MRLIFCFVKDFNSIITRFFTSTRINISTPFRVKIIPGVIIIRWYYWAKVVYPGLDSTRACGPPQRTWTRVLHKPGMLTPGLELIYPMQLFCVREGQMTAIWVDCEDAFFVIIWYICVCALVCAELFYSLREDLCVGKWLYGPIFPSPFLPCLGISANLSSLTQSLLDMPKPVPWYFYLSNARWFHSWRKNLWVRKG